MTSRDCPKSLKRLQIKSLNKSYNQSFNYIYFQPLLKSVIVQISIYEYSMYTDQPLFFSSSSLHIQIPQARIQNGYFIKQDDQQLSYWSAALDSLGQDLES